MLRMCDRIEIGAMRMRRGFTYIVSIGLNMKLFIYFEFSTILSPDHVVSALATCILFFFFDLSSLSSLNLQV